VWCPKRNGCKVYNDARQGFLEEGSRVSSIARHVNLVYVTVHCERRVARHRRPAERAARGSSGRLPPSR